MPGVHNLMVFEKESGRRHNQLDNLYLFFYYKFCNELKKFKNRVSNTKNFFLQDHVLNFTFFPDL